MKPLIEGVSAKMEKGEFDKFCSTLIRRTFKNPSDKSSPKLFTALIFCLDTSENESVVDRFRSELYTSFVTGIVNEKNLLVPQTYKNSQPILIQFYSPSINLVGPTAEPPNYFVSFTNEGVVMSTKMVT